MTTEAEACKVVIDGEEPPPPPPPQIVVQGTQDVQISDSSERAVNIGTIIGSWSWSTASKSLNQQILQVMCGNDTTASQLEKIKKRLSNYALKALCFALLILSAYLVQQYTSALFTIRESLSFLIVLVLFLITDAAITIMLPPNGGNALVCISWFFLEMALCILIVSCNGYYGFAILVVLLLVIAVALLQPKLQNVLSHYDGDTSAQNQQKIDGNTSAQNQQKVDGNTSVQNQQDIDDQHLDNLFELSQVIANSGSLVTAIFGHYMIMAGPVNPGGFLFFCSIALALYMMMCISARIVSLPHATCLAIVLIALIFITVITASIQVVVQGSGSTPQATKSSNHRKMLIML